MTPCSIPMGLHHPVCRIKSGVRLPTEALHVAHSPNAHDEKPQRSQLPHELLEQPPQLDEEGSDDDIIMPTGPPPPQRPRSKMMSSPMPSSNEMASSPIKYSPLSLKAHEQEEIPFENEAFKNLKSQGTEVLNLLRSSNRNLKCEISAKRTRSSFHPPCFDVNVSNMLAQRAKSFNHVMLNAARGAFSLLLCRCVARSSTLGVVDPRQRSSSIFGRIHLPCLQVHQWI